MAKNTQGGPSAYTETPEQAVEVAELGANPVGPGAQVEQTGQDPQESPQPQDPDAPQELTRVNYGDMKNEELRAELEQRGLATSGAKADLVARLDEDDARPVRAETGQA